MKDKMPLKKDYPLNKDPKKDHHFNKVPQKDHPFDKDHKIELSYTCNSEENPWGPTSATESAKSISQQNVEVECGLK